MSHLPITSEDLFSNTQASLADTASIDTGWIDMNAVSKYQLSYKGSAALSLSIESRPGASGSADLTTPAPYTGTFYLATLPVRQRWMRFILTNDTGGAVTDVTLAVKAIYGGLEGASVFPLEIAPSQFSPAALTQSVVIGKDTGGNYQNMSVNQAGSIVTDDFAREVARGTQTGYTLWNKFGYNEDIDSAADETIWAPGGIFSRMTSAETLTVVSSSANDTAAGTGVQQVVIYGVDSNWDSQTEVIALNGTTEVTTVNTWLGVNRVAIFLAGSGQTNAGDITVDTTTGGQVQAFMPVGEGVTQQCIFFVPRDTNFIAEWILLNVLKLSGGGGSPRVTVKMLVYSDVNNAVQEVFRVGLDTDVENTLSINPNLPFPIGERSVITLELSTDQNNTSVTARFSGILAADA
jgi:hypothetical protein